MLEGGLGYEDKHRSDTLPARLLFDFLESGPPPLLGGETYPPFDLTSDGKDHYEITVAVAGFKPEEVDITAQQNLLVVSGRKAEQDDKAFIHRGIATGSFERRFVLGDYVQVKSAEMKDGLLTVELVREIPEEMKPKKIAINGSLNHARLTDQRDLATNTNKTEKVAA